MLYENQNLYLNGLLHRYVTKKSSGHARKQNPTVSSNGKKVGRPPAENSKFSFYYSIRDMQGVNIRVCQKAFCSIHGFGSKRLQVLRRKIQQDSCEAGIEPDKRGKHTNHHSVSEEVCELIRDHIKSFPSRKSHYSRSDNPKRTYLSPELSICRMYQDFLSKHDPEYVHMKEENEKRKVAHQPLLEL